MANQRMTQTQLVRALAEHGEVNNKVARAILDGLAALAIGEVKKNGVFVLPGIGRLVRVDRKARTGRNPATGETIKIPAKKVVKFRVAKAAKDAIVPPKKEVGLANDSPAKNEPREIRSDPRGFLFCYILKPSWNQPHLRAVHEAYSYFFSSSFSSSSFKAVLKFRIPSPRPFPSSPTFLPPNNTSASTRIAATSGPPKPNRPAA